MTVEDLAAGRRLVSDACRVLAARGLADGFLGHVSLRIDDSRLLVRCRGELERGLAWTTPADVHLVDLDGRPGAPGELDGWEVPNELPLHTEALRRHPQVRAVVHAHPPDVVVADLAGISLRPVVGAFDIPAAHLAAGGVPVHPRAVLVRDRDLASAVLASMGERPVVVLRGHGLVTVGTSVPEAVLRAVAVDRLAHLSLAVVRAGGTLRDLPAEDLAGLPDLGPAFTEGVAWRHELARLPSADDLPRHR